MNLANSNNPSHYKTIIIGVFVTLFGIFLKLVIEHNLIIQLLGWFLTFLGAIIAIKGVFKILKD